MAGSHPNRYKYDWEPLQIGEWLDLLEFFNLAKLVVFSILCPIQPIHTYCIETTSPGHFASRLKVSKNGPAIG
jgi:hypothetical protein